MHSRAPGIGRSAFLGPPRLDTTHPAVPAWLVGNQGLREKSRDGLRRTLRLRRCSTLSSCGPFRRRPRRPGQPRPRDDRWTQTHRHADHVRSGDVASIRTPAVDAYSPASAHIGSLSCSDTGGRYWVRTSDLFGVNEARYHCANRPCLLRENPNLSTRPAAKRFGRRINAYVTASPAGARAPRARLRHRARQTRREQIRSTAWLPPRAPDQRARRPGRPGSWPSTGSRPTARTR